MNRAFHIKNNFKNRQGGFSVLFASLIGSLVLAIGLAILSITLKQITLASAGRESQRAFYAADTGTEFALYLDRGGANTDCNQGIFPIPGPDRSDEICGAAGDDAFPYTFDGIILNNGDGSGELGTNENFETQVDDDESVSYISVKRDSTTDNPICFDLLVRKMTDDDGITVTTQIESRGFNTCNEITENRFERAILTTY